MKKIEFLVGGFNLRSHDAAIVSSDEEPRDALVEAVIQNISTDVLITVGGVEMHLAAWLDPDHWGEDWAEKLGVDLDDATEAVEALLDGAITDET